MPDSEPSASKPSLEAALERLEAIVQRIEGNELELEASLSLFEEGVSLLRQVELVLATAEERVQQLVEEEGGRFRLEPLPGEE